MTENESSPGMQALSEALRVSFRAFKFLILALLAAYLASGIFVVRQHERALVLNFGKITALGGDRVKGPGIHWTWPRPFSEIVKLPAERVQTLSTLTFWRSPVPEYQEEDVGSSRPTLDPEREGYVLTGDANILHSKWTARYTIDNPETFSFRINDMDRLLRNELDRAVAHVSARFTIGRALRTDLAALRDGVAAELSRRCADLGLGIKIQGIDLTSITPPAQVANAFDAVVQAEQERAQKISEARAYASRTMNEAQGQASMKRTEGETYKKRSIAEISADADAFNKVLSKYAKNPAVFMQTMLQDTLHRTLAGVEQKYVIQGSGDNRQEIRLQLGPESARPRAGGLE